MKNKNLIYPITIWLLVITGGCHSYQDLDRENLKELYSLDNTLTAKYKIQHIDSLETIVYYQFNFDDFLYLSNPDSSQFVAKYQLKYQLFTNIQATKIIDSASVVFTDSINFRKNNSSLGYFEIQVPQGSINILRLELTDLNNNSEIVNLITIDKSSKISRQNFILQAQDELPLMNASASRNVDYRLIYNDLSAKTIQVKYFKSFLKPPQPPYQDNPVKRITKIRADSSFSINIVNGQSEYFRFDKQGIYHFMADTIDTEGFTVSVFTEGYPWISTPMQMIAPLRYITTSAEYEKLIEARDKKQAVDEFWLNLSSNEARAKAMISIYYNRVQEANMLFASEKEGWLTDRGMIYIVYGPPEKVFKNNELETWTYGASSIYKTLNFTFFKSTNPFTDNDFLLDRTPNYTNSWNSTIEFWRR